MSAVGATTDDEAIVLVAVFRARPETVDELRDRLISMVGFTRLEPGCQQYDLHDYPDDPYRFAFVETWASREALAAHDETEYVRAIIADAPRLTAGPLEIHRLRPITRHDRRPGGS